MNTPLSPSSSASETALEAAFEAAPHPRLSLVEIVELKWLLAGQGVHVHVEKLQNDAEYAHQMLDRVSGCANTSVREMAARAVERLHPA